MMECRAQKDAPDLHHYSEKWSYWLIFLRTNQGYFAGQGYLVGDGLYITERYQQGNWYYVYSDKPL
jgi:hypothetical protein